MNEKTEADECIPDEYNPSDFKKIFLASYRILDFFKKKQSYWKYNKITSNQHIAIGQGKCSNVFYNCAEVLRCKNLLEILACQLLKRIALRLEKSKKKVDYVVGVPYFLPSSGAFQLLSFSSKVAELLNSEHGFTRFIRSGLKEHIVWEGEIPEGANVLLVKEVVYWHEAEKIKEAIKKGNKQKINVLGFTASIIYFPPQEMSDFDDRVVSLIRADEDAWIKDMEDCPLCEKKSERVNFLSLSL